MSRGICSQCGSEIEGTSIKHRSRLFCSDECCETFEEEFLTKGEPGMDELEDEELDDEEFEFDDEEFDDEEFDEDEEDELDFEEDEEDER
jgi:hypothetical protein